MRMGIVMVREAVRNTVSVSLDGAAMNEHVPDPCTQEARDQGCTCSMGFAHSASIDPPEPVTDRHCPLHGRAPDPDDARDQAMEDDRFDRLLSNYGDEP
jgi:hypothetical protein